MVLSEVVTNSLVQQRTPYFLPLKAYIFQSKTMSTFSYYIFKIIKFSPLYHTFSKKKVILDKKVRSDRNILRWRRPQVHSQRQP